MQTSHLLFLLHNVLAFPTVCWLHWEFGSDFLENAGKQNSIISDGVLGFWKQKLQLASKQKLRDNGMGWSSQTQPPMKCTLNRKREHRFQERYDLEGSNKGGGWDGISRLTTLRSDHSLAADGRNDPVHDSPVSGGQGGGRGSKGCALKQLRHQITTGSWA